MFPCQVVIECRGVAVDKNALHRAVGAVGRLGDPWLFVCPVLDNSLVLNAPQVEPDRGRAVVIGYQ